jgi:hypothetical protein
MEYANDILTTSNIYEDGIDPQDVKKLIKFLQMAGKNAGYVTMRESTKAQHIFILQSLIENLE